jgi:hypothetical protein
VKFFARGFCAFWYFHTTGCSGEQYGELRGWSVAVGVNVAAEEIIGNYYDISICKRT